ncbi:MAG: RNA polymerase sigma factor RpoD/SigA [Nanoarchaeota archaeon]|nr:RNA polymerase sigma factor RpoD/SigA [Nanoarchaeota archaeon]
MSAGDLEAEKTLVEANLRFVVTVARGVARKYSIPEDNVLELIAEGNTGLERAARKYDGERGCKFITYAVWWIRQAMVNSLRKQAKGIGPENASQTRRIIGRAQSKLEKECGRIIDPSLYREEIAEISGLSEEVVQASLCRETIASLDADIYSESQEESPTLMNTIQDETSPNPEEKTLENITREKLESILSELDEREEEIVRLYFGIGTGIPYTLQQIGDQMGLTRERVRQLKAEGLEKLREPGRIEILEQLQ